ncbi:hypothetical protein [Roseibium aggregatum]|uniref:hypothetical protein n=1 Tax=Roseibium aggregatum TaxID=187304 RepID=UPI001E3BBDF0|nr:hypothetical protein [Roseibium aggregatum]UFI03823.1 hypothetical protein ST40_001410 [Roseibium aggregatum]
MLMFQILKPCLHRWGIEAILDRLDDRIDFGLGCRKAVLQSFELCSASGIEPNDLFGVLLDKHADEFRRNQIGLQALQDPCFERLTFDRLSI